MKDLEQCYRELEVAPFASKQDVRAAYKLLAHVWHPDRFHHSPDLRARAEDRFKRINAAYREIEDAGFPSVPQHEAAGPAPPAEPPPVLAECPWCGVQNRISWPRRIEVLRCGACQREFRLEMESGRPIRVETRPPPEANVGAASPPPASAESAPPVDGTTVQPTRRQRSSAAGCIVAGIIGYAFLLIIVALVDKPRPSGRSAAAVGGAVQRDANAWNDLGNRAAERRDWVQAVQNYERAAHLAPSNAVVLANLGVAFANIEKYDQAITTLQRAMSSDAGAQGQPQLLLWLAVSHILTGQYTQGLERADDARRLSPKDPEPQYWKARALVGLGRSDDARRSVRAALKLSDHAGARALLQTLEAQAEEARAQSRAAADAEAQARAARKANLWMPPPTTVPAAPMPTPVAVPKGGRWANSNLSEQERENHLRACLAPEREYAAPAGYRYQCDEENLTAVQATTLLLHRLLDAGRYRDAIALYREAARQQPQLPARVATLVTAYRDKGQLEVAYCLDPSNVGIRVQFETEANERQAYCAESK